MDPLIYLMEPDADPPILEQLKRNGGLQRFSKPSTEGFVF